MEKSPSEPDVDMTVTLQSGGGGAVIPKGKVHTCTYSKDGRICGKTFKYRCKLTRHEHTHKDMEKSPTEPDVNTTAKVHTCKICGKTFKYLAHLTEHERIHSGEKPNVCNICGKAFAQSGSLTVHKRIHSGEKPNVCNICGKAFTKFGDLTVHLRTHSGEKPYKCTTCGKTFKQSGNLKRHLGRHEELARNLALNLEFFEKYGIATTSAFGRGVSTRAEDITATRNKIMGNVAGFANLLGEKTITKWLLEQGSISFEELLTMKDVAAYVFITMRTMDSGSEEECPESHDFMTSQHRNPLWRMKQQCGDLTRLGTNEFNAMRRTYILAICESAYDATSLECELQHYLEDVLDMPHGMCLHQKAGSGNRLENSFTPNELERIKTDGKLTYSVAVTLVKTTTQEFFIGPLDETELRPLTSCTTTSHDGKTTFNIAVRGNDQNFPDTPSVLKDAASNKSTHAKTIERRAARKRNADEISTDARVQLSPEVVVL
jgi:hypothetical protein